MSLSLANPRSAGPPRKADVDGLVKGRKLQCGSFELPLLFPQVMAVINVTPDSFSDGGTMLRLDASRLRAHAEHLIEEGAAILDIGGESTRPGAADVSEAEECRRVLPVVELLLDLGAVISVDTSKAGVARRAIDLGAHMINDVRALADPEMVEVVAASEVAVALMHMRGEPRTMQRNPRYDDVVQEVRSFLAERLAFARSHGISSDRLCVDPGFGFGKSLTHNLRLLDQLQIFENLGAALMVGLSRKSMLGAITGREVSERLPASLSAALIAVQRGADIVRVHDVGATVDVLKVLRAVQLGELPDE